MSDQKICSYGYKLVCYLDDKFSKPIKIYRGKNAAYKFIEDMIKEEKYCYKILKNHFNKKIIITEEEKESFKYEGCCYICDKN